jgi:hypothetical protein
MTEDELRILRELAARPPVEGRDFHEMPHVVPLNHAGLYFYCELCERTHDEERGERIPEACLQALRERP